jgi:hypothetical protein
MDAAIPLIWFLRRRCAHYLQRCAGLGIYEISLHSYRYAWAERAKVAGYCHAELRYERLNETSSSGSTTPAASIIRPGLSLKPAASGQVGILPEGIEEKPYQSYLALCAQ